MPKLTVAQSAAINDYNKPMLVSASAGSGKTFTLIKKLVKYLEQGDLDNLVVLTFTKAAAAEMKNKLATELIKEIKANNNAQKFSEQLNKINTASIGTIDSFCNDIYSKYFEVAGLDPNLSIISQEEDSRYIASAFDSLLEKYLQDKSNKYNKVIYMLSENRKFNIEIIETIIGKVSLMPEIDVSEITAPYDVFKNELFKDYIIEIVNEALDTINIGFKTGKLKPKPEDGKIFTDIKEMSTCLSDFIANTQLCDKSIFKIAYDTMLGKIASINLDISSIYTAAKKREKLAGSLLLLKTSSEIINLAAVEKELITEIIEFAIECLELARANKQEDGYASYADIEKYAYDILSANNNLQAKEIAKNIDLICIDEYQDTNYMQEAIINCFEKDKLFFVGDIKQSIYGFRNADPLLFYSRYNKYLDGIEIKNVINAQSEQDLLKNFDNSEGAVLFFSENFRSSKEITNFANAFFSEFMTKEFGKVNYKENSMMEGRDIKYEDDLPPVIVSQYDNVTSADDSSKAIYNEIIYSVKDVPVKKPEKFNEGEAIVKHINYIVGKNIYEDMSTSRSIEYKDIAILARKNRDVKEMIKVLKEHNIPAKSSVNSEMSTEDRALILSIMELLDNPYQDVYLIHVLLSFFGGFNEKELAEISGKRTNRKTAYFHEAFFKFSKNNALKKKIDAFIAFLDKYRKLANSVSVSDLIMAIATETGYDALLMYDDHARINAFNIFVSYIKSVDTIKNIRSLLSFMKNSNIDETLNELFSTTMEENAVIVETMHRSKGLEYPIVFIMSHNADNNRCSKTILYNKELGFACDTYDFAKRLKTEGYIKNFIKHFVKKTEEEEDLRLIYVAFTRAKNHLIIMKPKASDKEKKERKKVNGLPDSSEKYERQIIASRMVYWLQFVLEDEFKNNTVVAFLEHDDNKYKSDAPTANAVSTRVKDMVNLKTYCKKGAKQKKVKYKYPYEESVSIEGKYSVTAINEQSKKGVQKRKINPIQDTQNIEKGITYHKVLELVDFNKTSKAEVESQLQQWHNGGIINKDLIDIDLMCEILNNKIFDRARIGKTLREQKFYYRDKASELLNGCKSEDLITVQGIIDLVIISGDEVILVDYKYTTQDDESVIETYKEQIEVYKKALEKVAKYKVTESYIFSLKDNKVIKM